jgi:hypothetical protein
MRKTFCAAISVLLFATGVLAQLWTDWSPTSDNSGIVYRSQSFPNQKACYLEFRDPQQGKGNTTFDVAVSYKSTDLNEHGQPTEKSDTEHVAVPPTRNASSRISNCDSVTDAKVNFVQRH